MQNDKATQLSQEVTKVVIEFLKEVYPELAENSTLAIRKADAVFPVISRMLNNTTLLRKLGYVQESEVRGMRWVTPDVRVNLKSAIDFQWRKKDNHRPLLLLDRREENGIEYLLFDSQVMRLELQFSEVEYLDESTPSPLYTEAELNERLKEATDKAYWKGWEAYGKSF